MNKVLVMREERGDVQRSREGSEKNILLGSLKKGT